MSDAWQTFMESVFCPLGLHVFTPWNIHNRRMCKYCGVVQMRVY